MSLIASDQFRIVVGLGKSGMSLVRFLAQQGVRVVGLNYKDDRQKAIVWLKELGNPYSLSLFDGDGMLGLDLGVYGAPETFLIDGKGIIRYRHAGDLNARVWESEIKPLWDKYSKEAAQ